MQTYSRRSVLQAGVVALICAPKITWAQGNPALAGTWSLDSGGGGRGGIRGIPVATELVIAVGPAEVTMDSNTGSARAVQTFLYKLDGTESSPHRWAGRPRRRPSGTGTCSW